MASDSEGFESAEEDAVSRKQRKPKSPPKESNAWNDSDSDDDLTNLSKGDGCNKKEEEPTPAQADSKAQSPNSEAKSHDTETGGDTSKPSQRSKRPERAPKQPKARGVKLGAVRLGSKSLEKAEIKDEDECHNAQRNVSKEGNLHREPSETSSRSSISSSGQEIEPNLEKRLSNLSTSSETTQVGILKLTLLS